MATHTYGERTFETLPAQYSGQTLAQCVRCEAATLVARPFYSAGYPAVINTTPHSHA